MHDLDRGPDVQKLGGTQHIEVVVLHELLVPSPFTGSILGVPEYRKSLHTTVNNRAQRLRN